jgi:hypothetical protein
MTTPQRPHRALLVLTAVAADDGHGNDPWSVFTTEGWTVDITRIGGRSPGPQISGAPLRASLLEQPGIPGRSGPDDADPDWADRDCADYDVVCFVDGNTTTWVSPEIPTRPGS